MNFDYVILGAGLQSLILLDRMRALGLNVCCVEPGPRSGDLQAHRTPFYVHRGHRFTERDWIGQLHDTYPHWQNIVRRLGVRIRSSESYVGFVGDSRRWTEAWDALDVPYTRTARKTGLLEGHRLNEVFTFPHMLFDARELLAKLRLANRDRLLCDTLKHVSPSWQGYRLYVGEQVLSARKLIVCADADAHHVLNDLPCSKPRADVQTRVGQVVTMRGAIANGSIVVPDAQMSIAPQYAADGSVVLLYTHGTAPLRTERNHRIDITRLEAQLDTLHATLPGLSEAGNVRGIYTTLQMQSVPAGKAAGPDRVFVESIADDMLRVLPSEPSFAMNASDQVLSLLNLHRLSAPISLRAAQTRSSPTTTTHEAIEGVQYA